MALGHSLNKQICIIFFGFSLVDGSEKFLFFVGWLKKKQLPEGRSF